MYPIYFKTIAQIVLSTAPGSQWLPELIMIAVNFFREKGLLVYAPTAWPVLLGRHTGMYNTQGSILYPACLQTLCPRRSFDDLDRTKASARGFHRFLLVWALIYRSFWIVSVMVLKPDRRQQFYRLETC